MLRAVSWWLPLDEGWSAGADEVSYRLLSRSFMRSPIRVSNPRGTGSRCHRNLLSSASVTSVNTRENKDLAIREGPFCAPLVAWSMIARSRLEWLETDSGCI